MLSRLCSCLVALLLVSCALPAQAPTFELATPRVAIPMDTSMDHIGVEVQLGDETLAFNLDTYAVTTACIDERVAERLGLEIIGTTLNGDGSGTVVTRNMVRIPELRVARATFRDVPALVDDYSWVATADGGSIDGLLGYHLFAELLLELDYPRRRVVLSRGALDADAPHVISHGTLRTQPDIPMTLDGETVVLGLDSGAQSALSLPQTLAQTLSLDGELQVVGRAKTVYSSADISVAQLTQPVGLAGHSLEGVRATFSELFGRPLVGHGLLSRFAVTFDQANGRVRFLSASEQDGAEAAAQHDDG